MKLWAVLFTIITNVLSSAYAQESISHKLAAAVQNVDIFVWGEVHEIKEQNVIFQEFLKQPEMLEFDAVGVEYVPQHMQKDFDEYLNNPLAISGSEAEKLFFSKILSVVIWPRTEDTRNTYRALWVLKQKKPTMKFCAIDQQYGDKVFTRKVWNGFTSKLRKKVLDTSKQGSEQIISSNFGYIREASIAYAISKCAEGSKKTLAHVGGYHALKPGIFRSAVWLPMTDYLSSLVPEKKIITLFNGIRTPTTNDPYGMALEQWWRASGYTTADLYTRTDLENSVEHSKLEITFPSGNMSVNLWDFVILGPPGADSTPD